jgi:hypothetical protein
MAKIKDPRWKENLDPDDPRYSPDRDPGYDPGISPGPDTTPDIPPDPGNEDALKGLDDYIKQFLNYEVPQEVIDQQLNAFAQQVSAKQSDVLRQAQFADSARTGGRMSNARRRQDITGEFAQARSAGYQGIMSDKAQQEMRARFAGLNAYISKYGTDKGIASAMNQLSADMDARQSQMWSSIFFSAAQIPFQFDWDFSWGGGADYSFPSSFGGDPSMGNQYQYYG